MSLIASDGYEYKDLAQRILGNPEKSARNETIRELRKGYPECECEAWYKAYDRARGPHADKYKSAWSALSKHRDASRAG